LRSNYKEKLLQLAVFEATFHDSVTPTTPDMVPLIMDTGASILITPYKTDFITPIRPVQHVTIKGIASALIVQGVVNVSYNFRNDAGEEQSLTLRNCLYVPQFAVRLICPRQIGAETGIAADGFNAQHENPILTVNGKQKPIQYDSLSNLPILFTTPGIRSYHTYTVKLYPTTIL